MAGKSPVTDHYTAEIAIRLTERNQYGDALSDSVINATYKLKLNGPAGLAYFLAQLDATIRNVRETMR